MFTQARIGLNGPSIWQYSGPCELEKCSTIKMAELELDMTMVKLFGINDLQKKWTSKSKYEAQTSNRFRFEMHIKDLR